MAGKIVGFLREYVFGLSIIIMIFGVYLLVTSILGIWFNDIVKDIDILNYVEELGGWNVYILIVGFIVFGIGLWYLYSYLKNRGFVLEEIKTNKRSELLRKHSELKDTVKHLPSKYRKMLDEKEEELRIK